ncbi:hypothetical protein Tco_0122227 [Tanacetum coccineum]
MVDSQPGRKEVQGVGEEENIDELRIMIKEHDQQTKTKATPKKLTYDNSKEEGSESSSIKGLSERSSRIAGTRSKTRSSRKSLRSLSRNKTPSRLRRS